MRTLAQRLVATYVLGAVVLVALVVAAVAAAVVSAQGGALRASEDAALALAPEAARAQALRPGGLAAAADDVARELVRPSVRIAVLAFGRGGERTFTTASLAPDGTLRIDRGLRGPGRGGGERDAGGPGDRDAGPGRRPDGPRGPGDRGRTGRGGFPLELGPLLRLGPREVPVPGGRVIAFPDVGPIARGLDALLAALLPIGAVAVCAAFVFGRYVARQALRPLAETTRALGLLAEGDFTPRTVDVAARDEIGELAIAYNRAARRVSEAFEERRTVEREMRQFVADAGHELRTPLTVVMGFVDVLRRRGGAEPATARIYETMLAESRRMRALVDKLIVLARLENADARVVVPVDLAALARRAAAGLGALAEPGRLRLRVEAEPFVLADDGELYDALANLVENAFKYAPGSPVDVVVGAAGDAATVAVRDAGPGIAPGDQGRIFDRFARGAGHGETAGFGLGLAIARRTVERAGGTLGVESELGAGACFTIRLPLARRGEALAAAV